MDQAQFCLIIKVKVGFLPYNIHNFQSHKKKKNCSSSLNQKALGTHSVTVMLNQANVIQFKLQPCLLFLIFEDFFLYGLSRAVSSGWPQPANLSAADFLLSHLQQVDRLPLVQSHDGQCQSHDKHRSYYFCFQ